VLSSQVPIWPKLVLIQATTGLAGGAVAMPAVGFIRSEITNKGGD
jgi:hypothetical protein